MNCTTPSQHKKSKSAASPEEPAKAIARLSNEMSPVDVPLVNIIQSKLQNVSMLPKENGSPVLMSPFTQSAMESLEDELKHMGYSIPRMFVERNTLYLEEYPISKTHERISRYFDGLVFTYNTAMTGDDAEPLMTIGSTNYSLTNGTVQPDAQYEVMCNPPRDCPNMVVEVAVSQELDALHHKCCRYLNESDNVLIVCGIKVYEDNAAVALIYQRNVGGAREVVGPLTAISFGQTLLTMARAQRIMYEINVAHVSGYVESAEPLIPCNHSNLDQYMITFNHLLLLAVNRAGGEVAAEHEHAPDLVIDLFRIQRRIL